MHSPCGHPGPVSCSDALADNTLCMLGAQGKHKASRRCMEAVVALIRLLLPRGHFFPRNVRTALERDVDGCALGHREVQYCAQASVIPRGSNRKPVMCNEPTVYYGTYTDGDGTVRSKADLQNCRTCGHTERKATYLIPLEQHIQVSGHSTQAEHSRAAPYLHCMINTSLH